MKQLVIKQGGVALEEVPAPTVKKGHILVQTAYSLISVGTEMSSVNSSGGSLVQKAITQPQNVAKAVKMVAEHGFSKTYHLIKTMMDMGMATGYSLSGTVLEVGEEIQNVKVGDLVACAGAGIANHAEVVCVPKNLFVKIPDKVSLADACSVTLGSIALQGVRQADPKLSDNVAVIGLGLLGQIAVQLLKANGCRVIGIDLDQKRIDKAKEFGLDFGIKIGDLNPVSEILKLTQNFGVDETIITAATASDEPLQQAMEMTRKKGTVVIVGAIGMNMQRAPFYAKEINLRISCSYGPGRYDPEYELKGHDYPFGYVRWTENRNMQAYLELIKEGKINFNALVEKEFAFENAPQAYEELKNPDKPLAIRLKYNDKSVETIHLSSVVPQRGTEGDESSLRSTTKYEISPHHVSDRINVAIIGAGNFATGMHLPNLLKLKKIYNIKAIVDPTGLKAKQIARQFDAQYCTTSYEDVLKDKNIDLVIICTPHYLHATQVIQAAKAGKAVFVEKPLCVNEQELTEIEQVLKDTKVPLMVGFNRRFSPHAKKIKEIIKDRHSPMIINYRVNGGYIPPSHWVQTEEGAGRIIGEACHMFDLFNYLTGYKVKNINVTSLNLPPNSKYLSSDNVVATLIYEDGSVCNLVYTAIGNTKLPKERVEIFCEEKSLVIDDYKNLETYGCKGGFTNKKVDKGHLQELIEFAESIKNKKELPISFEDIINATEISFKISKYLFQ